MQRLLIIRFSSLGDLVLTEPIVRALRHAYPRAELHFLTKLRHQHLLTLIPGLDRIHPWQPESQESLLSDLKSLHLDGVIDLHNNLRSHYVTRTLGVPVFRTRKEWFRRVAAVRLKSFGRRTPSHAVDRYAAALSPLHLSLPDPPSPCLSVPPENEAWWTRERVFRNLTGKYMIFAAGAAHATKQAPPELWQRIHASMARERDRKLILLGAPSERALLHSLADSLGTATVIAEPHICDAAAVLKSAEFVISNDSGIAHLAAALDTPTLSLFGPTHPVLGFAPLGNFADHYTVNEYCSPCSLHGKRRCHRDERFCFNRMADNVISERIKVLLDKKNAAAASRRL